jgi:hypothetical protein
MDNQEAKLVNTKINRAMTYVANVDSYSKISDILTKHAFEVLNPTTMSIILGDISKFVNPASYVRKEIYENDVFNFDKVINNMIRENVMLQDHGRAYVITSPAIPKPPIYTIGGKNVYTVIYVSKEEN